MSETVTLSLRQALERTLSGDALSTDRCAGASAKEIGDFSVLYGGQRARLGDLFTVQGERATRLRLVGDLARVQGLGAGMTGGEIVVEGNVGHDTGVGMSGGVIDIRGDAGDNLGGAAPGASRGMTGGEIVVRGKAGADPGSSLRRGLIVIGGDAGERAGQRMIAGSLVLFGSAGRGAGRWTKRGTIVAVQPIERPATFRYACTYRPPHVSLTFRYLRKRFGFSIADRYVMGRYERYSGDLAEIGKGEILQWVAE
jgi:formylmethanofuran dehydrogenase subunit C